MDDDEKKILKSTKKNSGGNDLQIDSFDKQSADIEFIDFMAKEYSNGQDSKIVEKRNSKADKNIDYESGKIN